MFIRALTLISVVALLAACDVQPAPATDAAAASSSSSLDTPLSERIRSVPGVIDWIWYPDDPMLPAYETRAERLAKKAAKADSYDDTRYATPQNYAITLPPQVDVRPMVEWEPMQAIMMGIPSYVVSSYSNTTQTVVNIAKNAATVAEVWFVVSNTSTKNLLTSRLTNEGGMSQTLVNNQVKFFIKPLDSIWFIDYGPLPIIASDNTFAFADFRYYHQRPLDDGVPSAVGRSLTSIGVNSNTETYRMPLNTEGGTFQATTDGICFTGNRQIYNQSCEAGSCDNNIRFQSLASVQTHPLTLELAKQWADYAGCVDTIVMNSITDDGTGHIDMYFKVVDDNTLVMGDYRTPYQNTAQQTNAARMDANVAFLEAYVKPDGSKFKVERIVMPGHRNDNFGSVPFTYINSTFINGLNLWPATEYSDWVSSRNVAQAEWEAIMPDYEHIYIDSTELSFASGAIHCITRTVPALPAAKWVGDGTCGGETCTAPADGYDGACSPNGISSQVCYGPNWLCGCNDCDSTCPGSTGTSDCGSVGYEGCCNGNQLRYCDGGALLSQGCNSCGWDTTNGWYDCGQTGADPSGTFPLSCDDPPTCEPSCSGKACGGDGCGGTCGTCQAGETCTAGACEPQADPCDGITFEGCCNGDQLVWCENNQLNGNNCNVSTCGWDSGGGFYNCGTAGGADPSGTNPKSCAELTCDPDCDGKTCGDDGCGGTCGTCGSGTTCKAGLCKADCAPDCSGKQCGTDGCGGICGQCAGLLECKLGSCVAPPCEPACDGKACGADGCGGSCGACAGDETCNASGACVGPDCTPACDGKVCGPDTCGGSCGTCGEGTICNATGLCEAVCAPLCTGMQCGSDGCGGACGTCGDGQQCTAGQCEDIACVPFCEGKQCGDDGCGGICGICAEGEECTAQAQCETIPCIPACAGKVCGSNGCGGTCGACAEGESCADGQCVEGPCVPSCIGKACGDDGCEGSCGACADGQQCGEAGQCEAIPCEAQCSGKDCGDDGCGGSCGACADGQACAAGACAVVDGCGDVSATGQCDGSVVTWCEAGSLKSSDCADLDRICGEKEGVGFTCIDPCIPDCTGKQCGDNGCGGVCGSCPPSWSCNDSAQCEEPVGPGDDEGPGTPDEPTTPDTAADTTPDVDAGGTPDVDAGGTPDVDAGGTPDATGGDTDLSEPAVDGSNVVKGASSSGCAGGTSPLSGALPLALLALWAMVTRRRREV